MDPVERAITNAKKQIARLEDEKSDYLKDLDDTLDKATRRELKGLIREREQRAEALRYALNFLENTEEG